MARDTGKGKGADGVAIASSKKRRQSVVLRGMGETEEPAKKRARKKEKTPTKRLYPLKNP